MTDSDRPDLLALARLMLQPRVTAEMDSNASARAESDVAVALRDALAQLGDERASRAVQVAALRQEMDRMRAEHATHAIGQMNVIRNLRAEPLAAALKELLDAVENESLELELKGVDAHQGAVSAIQRARAALGLP